MSAAADAARRETLGFQAEARLPLPFGADSKVADPFAFGHVILTN